MFKLGNHDACIILLWSMNYIVENSCNVNFMCILQLKKSDEAGVVVAPAFNPSTEKAEVSSRPSWSIDPGQLRRQTVLKTKQRNNNGVWGGR